MSELLDLARMRLDVEITDAMVWEGIDALLHHDPDWNDRETAILVFRRMWAVRNGGQPLTVKETTEIQRRDRALRGET